MRVNAIRKDIAAAMKAGGYKNAKAFVPEDSVQLPAAIVDIPRRIEYGESLGLAMLEIPVMVIFSLGGSNEDAQERLDAAMSTEADEDGPTPVKVILDAAKSPNWRTIRVTGIEHPRLVRTGKAEGLGCDFIVTVHTQKNYNG